MLKKLMITTAVTALMIGSALAAEGDGIHRPDAGAVHDTSAGRDTSTRDDDAKSTRQRTATSSAKFINSQRQDQYLGVQVQGHRRHRRPMTRRSAT